MNKCIHASITLAMTSIKTPPSKANTLLLSILATTLLAGCGGSEGDSNDDAGQVIPTVYSISATATQGGSISPALNTVESGYTTSFTVTPDTGYVVNDISGCGGSLAQNTYRTGAINTQCTVAVSFKLSTFKITTQAATGGQVSPESIDVSYNTNASFNISPDIGYKIQSVTGCNGTLNNTEYTTGTIASDCQINATFTTIGDGSISERYTDNGNGTITDKQTNLMWIRCSLGQTWQDGACKGSPSTFSWLYANTLSYSDGNHSDWRLPTKEELSSLVFCSSGKPIYWKTNDELCTGNFESPTIAQTAFPQTPSGPFWTSTAQDNASMGNKWLIYFDQGYGRWNGPILNLYVRLVRDN
ncbi:DUF1566 domain-containing protein [Shewanella sp. TB7-MNA-CIBAN-0143]|uniref:DUF1566 domain-containing protein n=1 Tax=unclassified Shewanella TaxID=196818 RepID=UPI00332B8E7C